MFLLYTLLKFSLLVDINILVVAASFSVGFGFNYIHKDKPPKLKDNFKQEILNYSDFDVDTFKNEVLLKVHYYSQTITAKSMVSSKDDTPANQIID